MGKDSLELKDIREALNNLSDLSEKFRGMVNEYGQQRLNYDLTSNSIGFNKICSAMDIINDITMGFYSYLEHRNEDKGLGYIYIFGLLESLYLQQNAVRALGIIIHELCNLKKFNLTEKYPEIENVRNIRHWIAGHPISDTDNHFINRHSITLRTFDFMLIDAFNKMEFKTVDLFDLIKIQADNLSHALTNFINLLIERDQMHRDQFKNDSLENLFRGSGYLCEKLFIERSQENFVIVPTHLKMIKELIENFCQKLSIRHPVYAESSYLKFKLPTLNRAILRLESYIKFDLNTTDEDAVIWASWIQTSVKELQEWAIEIDNHYAGKEETKNSSTNSGVNIIINGIDLSKNFSGNSSNK